jgi:CHAT domain-containing protein
MRPRIAALLLLALAAACPREEQSAAPPVTPEALYARGYAELRRGERKSAGQIAGEGQRRFGAEPKWRERFAILEAEAGGPKRAILDRTPESGDPAMAVRRLIVLATMQQDAKSGNEILMKADALAARAPELRPEIAARRVLLLFRLKQADEARRCAREAIAGATAAKQPWLLAAAYKDLAFMESQQTRWADAIEHYSAALKYAQAMRSKPYELGARVNLGWCQSEAGDFDPAMENLAKGLALARELSVPLQEHIALIHIADIYVRRIELDKALPYAQRAREVGERERLDPARRANAYHQLGQIYLKLGKLDEAERWNDKAIETRVNEQKGVLQDMIDKARILDAKGDPAEALKILRTVLASKDAQDDLPMRWRAEGIEATIHARLGDLAEAEHLYEATLETGAKARARVQGESSFAFERNLLSFYEGYIDLLLDAGRTADALAVAERSRGRYLREIDLQPNVPVDAVLLAKEKNATLLFYWLGAQRSRLWTVTPRGIDVATLPPDDEIDKAADEYRAELQSRRHHSLAGSALGPSLYGMLVAPAKIAPSSRVIIFPDAHLNALSFDALIVPTPARHYWIEDVTVSYAPSLHLVASTPAWKGVRGGRVLLFGGIPDAGPQFPRLGRAAVEIDDVEKHFDRARCVRLAGAAATPSAYKTATRDRYELIHFAAHATASTDMPLESAVILAPDKNDFRLTGREIVKQRLEAELVTVSSCNSAGRRSYAGEGLVGLAWAFLGAGAHRVVAAQWEVSDSAAPQVMDRMYAAIAAGIEPAEALRRAKLALLHSNGVHERPLYWAPFVIYGAM